MLTGAQVNGPYVLITTTKLEPWFYFRVVGVDGSAGKWSLGTHNDN